MVLSAKLTFVAILALIGTMSNVFAASCIGVTYLVVLSAMLTFSIKLLFTSELFAFNLILLLILVGSNAFAANCLGVTYLVVLSVKFTLLFKAVLIASAVSDVIFEAIISFTIFL